MEYLTAEEAAEAVKTCDGYRLDKSHNFAVNLLTDFEKYVLLHSNLNMHAHVVFEVFVSTHVCFPDIVRVSVAR